MKVIGIIWFIIGLIIYVRNVIGTKKAFGKYYYGETEEVPEVGIAFIFGGLGPLAILIPKTYLKGI